MTSGYDPETKQFTFLSGRSVRIRHVSHHLVEEVTRALPPPPPPIIKTKIGDKETEIENTADPDYLAARVAYEREVTRRFQALYTLRGAEFTLGELEKREIAALRADMALINTELPEDDRIVYLYHLCLTSETEEVEFLRAVRGYSQPTKEATAAAAATFRGPLPGETDRAMATGEERGEL